MQLKCDHCGPIPHVLIDGYRFGDRLLEGVGFVVKDVAGKPVVEGVTKECKTYFDGLNREKWMKACAEYAVKCDVADCPTCGEQVGAWGSVDVPGSPPAAAPRLVMKKGGPSFLKRRPPAQES